MIFHSYAKLREGRTHIQKRNIRIWQKFKKETAVQGRLIDVDFLLAWKETRIQQKNGTQHSHDLVVAIGLQGCTYRNQPFFLRSSTNSTAGFWRHQVVAVDLRVEGGMLWVRHAICVYLSSRKETTSIIQIASKNKSEANHAGWNAPTFWVTPCRRSFVLSTAPVLQIPKKWGVVKSSATKRIIETLYTFW